MLVDPYLNGPNSHRPTPRREEPHLLERSANGSMCRWFTWTTTSGSRDGWRVHEMSGVNGSRSCLLVIGGSPTGTMAARSTTASLALTR